MAKDKMTAILELAEAKGILRPKDVQEEGLPRQYVYRLYEQGKLDKISRGLYKLPEKQFSMSDTQLEACKRITHGVLCLKTALRFHDMTTQNPHKIWMAIDVKAWEPEVDLPMKYIRMSGESFESGIEEHKVDKIPVRVYSAAKTVADCFKFRSKIGLEVCLDALRDFRFQNIGTMDDIWKYAKINRVLNVMRPYMEAQR